MEDLQSLLEKINRDGVEKAEAEAKKIVDAAKARASAVVADAEAAAAKMREDAERDTAAYVARAEESLRQAARDTVIKVENSILALLEKTLAKDVEKALSDEKTICDLVAEAVKGLASPATVSLPPALAPAVKARLAANEQVTVVLDEVSGSGFSVKTDGGRVESSFSAEDIASEIAKRLSPDLAKLIK